MVDFRSTGARFHYYLRSRSSLSLVIARCLRGPGIHFHSWGKAGKALDGGGVHQQWLVASAGPTCGTFSSPRCVAFMRDNFYFLDLICLII